MGFVGSWWFRVPAILVVLLVAAGLSWWFFIREDNDLATEAPEIHEVIFSRMN
jgi:hypothetical protein